MIFSHRVLRYATPLLHVVALLATLAELTRGRARLSAAAHAAVLGAAASKSRARPALIARYYVLTTASLAAGLYDHLRHGTPPGWDAPEGTR